MYNIKKSIIDNDVKTFYNLILKNYNLCGLEYIINLINELKYCNFIFIKILFYFYYENYKNKSLFSDMAINIINKNVNINFNDFILFYIDNMIDINYIDPNNYNIINCCLDNLNTNIILKCFKNLYKNNCNFDDFPINILLHYIFILVHNNFYEKIKIFIFFIDSLNYPSKIYKYIKKNIKIKIQKNIFLKDKKSYEISKIQKNIYHKDIKCYEISKIL